MLSLLFSCLFTLYFAQIRSAAVPGNQTVFFDRHVLSDSFVGDYGVRKVDLNGDGRMDLVAYGWASGVLAWFENPSWQQRIIGKFRGIVDIDFADINNDSRIDIIVAWDLNVPPESDQEGQIGWLNNTKGSDLWHYSPIADSTNFIPGIHRVRIGQFLPGSWGVIGVPIFDFGAKAEYYNQTYATIRYFPLPSDINTRTNAWESVVVSQSLHICHTLRKYTNATTGIDFLITNALEGVVRIDLESNRGASLTVLNEGMSVGNVGGKPSFMAQIAPWEGVNILSPVTVSLLTPASASGNIFEGPLNRLELDILGPQAHDVATGDFNNDGCDDFLVGIRGPVQGVWFFECLNKNDLSKWSFYPVSLDQSYGASQLVTHDFNNDGKLDWAATGFPGFPGSGGTGNHYVAIYFQK